MQLQINAIDLSTVSPQGLRNMLNHYDHRGLRAEIRPIISELYRRGPLRKADRRFLACDQARVKKLMEPFVELAESVPDSRRTAYTEAGGLRIGRPKGDPERYWIDTYTAIKTDKIDADLICYVKEPGDDPEFTLRINGVPVACYKQSELGQALDDWRDIARDACSF